jgi:hypothetical protein
MQFEGWRRKETKYQPSTDMFRKWLKQQACDMSGYQTKAQLLVSF